LSYSPGSHQWPDVSSQIESFWLLTPVD